jgi:gliding motility-associated-like protein
MRVVEIRLPELLHIPNAFTPNHDGKNDHWTVKGENITRLNVTIYTRWGQPIYQSSSPDFEWDGMYNGRMSEGGVYIYKLNATGIHGMEFEKTGKLTLVR